MPVPGTSWISNLFGRAPHRQADEIPASQPVASQISPWLAGVPSFPANTTGSVISEGYLKNPLIQEGIRLIVDTFAQAELTVRREGSREVLKGHDLPAVIRRPEPRSFEYALWEWTLVDLFTTGNCFWELVRSKSGRIVQIWQLKVERMSIIADSRKWIRRYEYLIDGKPWPIAVEDVLHWKFYHPLDRFFGLSPILAALRPLHTDNAATDFLKLTLDNRAVPDIVVTAPGTLTKPDVQQARKEWKEAYGGRNRGGVAFIGGNVEVKTLGMSLEELAFPELQAGLETRILMSLGGAPLVYMTGSKAGMDRSTFANFGDAREALTTEIVMPLIRRAQGLMTSQLLHPNYPDAEQLEAVFETRRINAMEERRTRRAAVATQWFLAGVGTRNEARQMTGDTEDLFDDVICRPVNVDFLPVTKDGHVLEPKLPEPAPGDPANPGAPGDTAADTADDFGAN